MSIIRIVAIALGLTCAAVDLYVATSDDKTRWHRAGHLSFGLVFGGLVYLIWMTR